MELALRQGDGSFTKETYNINLNRPAKQGSTPSFQQSFFNCVGLAARTRTPGPPRLGTDPLGTGGTNPIMVDLAGTGLPFVVGLWQTSRPNALVVGQLNGDFSAKGSARAAWEVRHRSGILRRWRRARGWKSTDRIWRRIRASGRARSSAA